jgi:hypothetical protein
MSEDCLANSADLLLWLQRQQAANCFESFTARILYKRFQRDPAAVGVQYGFSGPTEWLGGKPTYEETIWLIIKDGPARGLRGYLRRSRMLGTSVPEKVTTYLSLKIGDRISLYLSELHCRDDKPLIALTMTHP